MWHQLNMEVNVKSLGTAHSPDVRMLCMTTAERIKALRRDISMSGDGPSLLKVLGETGISFVQYNKLFCYIFQVLCGIIPPLFLFLAFLVPVDEFLRDVLGWFYRVVLRRKSLPSYDILQLTSITDQVRSMIYSILRWADFIIGPCLSRPLPSVGFRLGSHTIGSAIHCQHGCLEVA